MTSGEPKRALISGVTGQDGAYVAREGGSDDSVPAFRHAPEPGCLAGLVEARRKPVMRSDALSAQRAHYGHRVTSCLRGGMQDPRSSQAGHASRDLAPSRRGSGFVQSRESTGSRPARGRKGICCSSLGARFRTLCEAAIGCSRLALFTAASWRRSSCVPTVPEGLRDQLAQLLLGTPAESASDAFRLAQRTLIIQM